MHTNVGKVCFPKGRTVLACSGGMYQYAICVNDAPFILVSEDADMLWGYSGFTEDDFVIGPVVNQQTLEKVMTRYADHIKRNSDQN